MGMPKGNKVITYVQRTLLFHITVVKATDSLPPKTAHLYRDIIALHCRFLEFSFSLHVNGCDLTRLQLLPWTSTL